ncbi:MAG: IS3 family transposase [Chitinophagales bacterium]|jgi:putative transposase
MKRNERKYPVEMMSRSLGVSRSGYYKWLNKSHIDKQFRLDEQIKQLFLESKCRYGSPRITTMLHRTAPTVSVSRSSIARRMRKLGVYARKSRKYTHTTDSKHNLKISPNLLDRQFNVQDLNKVWVSDITYIGTTKGWVYLTVVLDLADRAIVGWSLSETLHAEPTVIEALKMALVKRRITRNSGLMFHSDRGIQYACQDFRAVLKRFGIEQSMSRKGNCWDNAVAESFFKTIKTEELDRYKQIDAKEIKSLVFKYIEGWYNTNRIHGSLDGKTPWEAFYEKSTKLAA